MSELVSGVSFLHNVSVPNPLSEELGADALTQRTQMSITATRQDLLFETPREGSVFDALLVRLGVSPGPGWCDRFGEALTSWSSEALPKPIRTLSLFSGAGGLDIGFHDAGFQISQMVEIEPKFCATLEENSGAGKYFGTAHAHCLDIREFQPDPSMKVDFIVGGPPCQTFSAAGRRAAGVRGTQDDRGVLFEEYVRLLKVLQPKGFLFENVYGIVGAEKGEAWKRIKIAFAEAGYTIHYRILDTADYGVPQHRERLFIVGTRGKSFKFPRPTHGPDSPGSNPYHVAKDAVTGVRLSPEERSFKVKGRFGHLLDEIPAGLNYSFFTERMGHPQPIFAWRSKFSDFLYKAAPDSPVRTIKAQGGQYTGPFHWENRPFSVAELKRLQTFPDKFDIVGKRQIAIQQIGNSVPPQVARVMALSILNQLFGVELPVELPYMEEGESLGFRTRKRELTHTYRAKADAAVKKVSSDSTPSKELGAFSYYAELTTEFGWKSSSKPVYDIKVQGSTAKDGWSFHLSQKPHSKRLAFVINLKVHAAGESVFQGVSVQISGNKLTPALFTSAWKAFEAELAERHIKADLVQLNGYYQYPSAIEAKMEFVVEPNWQWSCLARIVNGAAVAEILPEAEMADRLDVERGQVMELSLWLRSLGYEVRNHYTNPQIPKGSYLIPYKFPSLVPLSVQLRKSLNGHVDG